MWLLFCHATACWPLNPASKGMLFSSSAVFLLQEAAKIAQLVVILSDANKIVLDLQSPFQISFISSTIRARQWITILCSGAQWYCLTDPLLQHSESLQQNFGNTLQLHCIPGIDNRRYFFLLQEPLTFCLSCYPSLALNSSNNFSAGRAGPPTRLSSLVVQDCPPNS